MKLNYNTLGIDIGSTTVKIAILNAKGEIVFSDYQRHYANIQETLSSIINDAYEQLGDMPVAPMITGSGGLTLSGHLEIPFVQEVVAVATSLKDYAPQTDVAIELGGEDAKIIYFTGGIDHSFYDIRFIREISNRCIFKIYPGILITGIDIFCKCGDHPFKIFYMCKFQYSFIFV